MNEKVYVVTASYQKEGGDLDYTTNIGVYKSKEGATKALIEVAIEYLPCYDCESAAYYAVRDRRRVRDERCGNESCNHQDQHVTRDH